MNLSSLGVSEVVEIINSAVGAASTNYYEIRKIKELAGSEIESDNGKINFGLLLSWCLKYRFRHLYLEIRIKSESNTIITTDQMIFTKSDEIAFREGCYYNHDIALKTSSWIETFCQHSKGAWANKPFILLPYQKQIIWSVFGWLRPNGDRRFQKVFIEIPKKNGKSTLAAAIGAYLLIGDNEDGADIFSLGCNRDQALIVHSEAIKMIEASPALALQCKVTRSTHKIIHAPSGSSYQAVASDASARQGVLAHGLIFDELHAWRGEKGKEVYGSLIYSTRARRQPITWQITTAGDDTDSICWDQHEYASGVLDGSIIDTRYFAVIYTAPSHLPWDSEEAILCANPAAGELFRVEDVLKDAAEARRSPTAKRDYERYTLNRWTHGFTPYLSSEDWGRLPVHVDGDEEPSDWYGGLDMASTTDYTAFVRVGAIDDKIHARTTIWIPEGGLDRTISPSTARRWAAEGWLTVTDGNEADYERIGQEVVAQITEGNIREVAYDPWNAEATTQKIVAATGIERFKFLQRSSYFNEPCRELERLVRLSRIITDGNQLLQWMIGNCNIAIDSAGIRRPIRPKTARKIDGAVALLMALGLFLRRSGSPPEEIPEPVLTW